MSDNKISLTIQQYKEFDQLQEYACAQEQTILQMSRKVQKYEDQIKHLETLLKSSIPTINSNPKSVNDFTNDDSEYIATVEIAKLKQVTLQRPLTLEETRMFDTYYKILNNIKSKPNKEKEVQETPTADLLKIVESKNDNGK